MFVKRGGVVVLGNSKIIRFKNVNINFNYCYFLNCLLLNNFMEIIVSCIVLNNKSVFVFVDIEI